MTNPLPSTGFSAIKDHWKDDLSAGASVSLVALPLTLGIAIAAGLPAMSGITSIVIAGILTTFIRGSHVAINGSGAGLIVVLLGGLISLGEASHVFGAIVISGAIQMLLGLLRMGKLGDLIPSSVVQGMLAAIGITIFSKQIHVALGVDASTSSALNALTVIPESLSGLNWVITSLSMISLMILIFQPRVTNKFVRSIPGPLLVLMVAVPIVFLVKTFSSETNIVWGSAFYFSSDHLINIPDNLLDVIVFPSFDKVVDIQFWSVVIGITLISSIETLVSTKAVDRLDEFKRRSDLNKELFAVGASTIVSGFLGGLPINTVIVRSSVNINHNAKTRLSNFYHGVLILAFVYLFPFLMREIPLACLATILVYTGYKLASPRVFRSTLQMGWEQLLILIVTLFISLATDILWGIFGGICVTLLIHWLRSELNFRTFVKHMLLSEIVVTEESESLVHVDIRGIANFVILLRLINSFKELKEDFHYVVNFSRTKLVDSTVLDFIHEHREKYFTKGDFEFVGLEVHKTSSNHPLALHVLERPMQKRLSVRQNEILHYSSQHGYKFDPSINWHVERYVSFKFFEHHLLEFRRNRLMGIFEENCKWVIADVKYNDGVMFAREEHHITAMTLFPKESFEDFLITKETVRNLKLALSKGKKQEKDLTELERVLVNHSSFEVQGADNDILIYRRERLLSNKEQIEMHDFAKDFHKVLPRKKEATTRK